MMAITESPRSELVRKWPLQLEKSLSMNKEVTRGQISSLIKSQFTFTTVKCPVFLREWKGSNANFDRISALEPCALASPVERMNHMAWHQLFTYHIHIYTVALT